MMHKTQIYNANKGDHYRNRLTHTLEVSQIARSLGRLFHLNEDLIEAISLAHDLGHTPFGHIGERTLNDILMHGIDDTEVPPISEGFKHNYQSVRVVDSIENRCDEHPGLNLTLTVKEGIIKHTGIYIKGTDKLVIYSSNSLDISNLRMDLKSSFTLEGQVVAISDEIAQLTHDIEDGIRSEAISFKQFVETDLVQKYYPCERDAPSYNKRNQIIKGLVGHLIDDVADSSTSRIDEYHSKHGIPTFENKSSVYEERCIWFSDDIEKMAKRLATMRDNCILFSKEISQSDSKSEYFIRQIFKAYFKHPKELPDYILARYYNGSSKQINGFFDRTVIQEDILKKDPYFVRLICDHIAGMSDQFAAREYMNLYTPEYH